jgi:excisionase family DNA binding protein
MEPATEDREPQQRLLTVKEYAEAVRCSRVLVYRLIRAGRLPVLRVGRLVRIPASALEPDGDGR